MCNRCLTWSATRLRRQEQAEFCKQGASAIQKVLRQVYSQVSRNKLLSGLVDGGEQLELSL
jgi:hypothetical protein